MASALFVFISIMWVPVVMCFFGVGQPKRSGIFSAAVGILVIIGATIQAVGFADHLSAGLLFVFGALFLQAGLALTTGVTNLRTIGNGAVLAACALYAVFVFVFASNEGVNPDMFLAKIQQLK